MDGLDEQPKRDNPTRALLARALKRARSSLLWERLWPALATLATALGLFLAFSWAGLWLVLPPLARAIGLVLFVIVTAIATVPLVLLRLPSVNDGLRRLDRSSGETHRPATAVADQIAANQHDPVAQALWRAHVERALLSARKLKAGWPSPRLAMRDPMALRALVLILAVASFFAAGGERLKRVTAAFDWQGVVAPANFRIDAWVTPPVYTGRPPVMLAGLRPGENAHDTAPVAVPAGSQLVVRATGNVRFDIVRKGGLEDAPPEPHAALPAGSEERRFVIKGDGAAVLHGVGSSDLAWTFTAIPDRAPTIALIKDPERQARGSLRLDYKMDDDYGVVEAHAAFALKDDDAENERPTHSLFSAPEFPLTLPQARTRSGAAQTTRDLTEHPWAGAKVAMTLVARDEAGNEGRSEPTEFQLPQRIFVKPVARALIEQRRILALDADAKPLVLTALDALTIAPEHFTPETAVYLGLRAIYFDLAHAKSDDQLREVVARMWDMAVQLEDGNVSQAELALRAGAGRPAPGARTRRQRRRAEKADGSAARRHGQIPAGAGGRNAQEPAAARAPARPQYPHAQPARSQEHARPAGEPGALRQQGGRAPTARATAIDAREPADGAPGRPRRRGRRRHDVGARRTGRHDPQATAIARQDLQAGPGHAARPPAPAARSGSAAVRRSAPGPAGLAGPA